MPYYKYCGSPSSPTSSIYLQPKQQRQAHANFLSFPAHPIFIPRKSYDAQVEEGWSTSSGDDEDECDGDGDEDSYCGKLINPQNLMYATEPPFQSSGESSAT